MYNPIYRFCSQQKKVNLRIKKLFFLAICSIAIVNVCLSLSVQAQEKNVKPSSYTNPGIVIGYASLTMKQNDIGLIRSLVVPLYKEQKVYWSSSNPDIVYVDSYGCLIAKNVGEAEITAKSYMYGIENSVKITVINPIKKPTSKKTNF